MEANFLLRTLFCSHVAGDVRAVYIFLCFFMVWFPAVSQREVPVRERSCMSFGDAFKAIVDIGKVWRLWQG